MAGRNFGAGEGWICSVLVGMGAIVAFATPTGAQLIEDTAPGRNLGTTVQRNVLPGVDLVGGGTRPQNGQNLFHSFQEFNVPDRGGVYFANPAGVQNILSRVTGSNRSNILGTIGVLGPANLFLINPNGIVFGPNSSLDVQGSFFATTANAVQLENDGLFSASQPASSNLLNVNPSAFLFNAIANQNLPEIVVRSQATTTALGNPTNGLQVSGTTLLLLGGNVVVNGGQLNNAGGRVEIGAVGGAGRVDLLTEGKLIFPLDVARAAVEFGQGSSVNVSSEVGGSISVMAATIQVSGRSVLGVASTQGSSDVRAGDLILNATGAIDLKEQSAIANIVTPTALSQAGDIILTSKVLQVSSGAGLTSSTLGKGNAGNVIISASDVASFDGTSVNGLTGSKAFSTAELGSEGKSGDVRITTNSLSMVNGAILRSSTAGKGDAGDVKITAMDRVSFDRSFAFSNAEDGSEGNGGDVKITANSLSMINGAALISSTFSKGDAGDVIIATTNAVFSNESLVSSNAGLGSEGNGGDVKIITNSLSMSDRAQLNSSTFGKGNAGNVHITASGEVSLDRSIVASTTTLDSKGNAGDVNISANSLSVGSRTLLFSSTFGKGNAGNVHITASGKVSLDRSNVLSDTFLGSEGDGGDVNISADTVQLTNDALLSSITSGKGNAGNVQITASSAVSLDRSDIASSATPDSEGKGGDINITANSLSLTNRAVVSASNLSRGDAGTVAIHVGRDVQLNNSDIETRSQRGSGGDIQISAERIRLFDDGDVGTSVETGGGRGGDITLIAKSIIALNDSDILTFSTRGRGGNITFNTPAFFGQNYRPGNAPPFDDNNRVDINASGTVSGIITIPDTTFIQNSLNQLPQTLIDTGALLANSCIVRRNQPTGNFFITGSGGLPERPGTAASPAFPTGEVQNVEQPEVKSQESEAKTQNSKLSTQNSSARRPWKIGDPIVEPQGVYQLPDGQLVLSHECSK